MTTWTLLVWIVGGTYMAQPGYTRESCETEMRILAQNKVVARAFCVERESAKS